MRRSYSPDSETEGPFAYVVHYNFLEHDYGLNIILLYSVSHFGGLGCNAFFRLLLAQTLLLRVLNHEEDSSCGGKRAGHTSQSHLWRF